MLHSNPFDSTRELKLHLMIPIHICTLPCSRLALCIVACTLASSQTVPWTTALRGSWVQTGPRAPGDVLLAGRDRVSEVVVGDNENSAVHQAAEFLAGDIQRISGTGLQS